MMTAVEYLRGRKRMCDRYIGNTPACEGCPLDNPNCTGCSDYEETCPEEVIRKVEKWVKENPEETILSDFLKKYPNANLGENDIPFFCCEQLFHKEEGKHCPKKNCIECWNRPLSEVQYNND